MVALVLALAGVGGATAVFYAARAQHARDRRAIEPWLRVAAPAIADARRAIDVLGGGEGQLRAGNFRIGADVEHARGELESVAKSLGRLRAPKVLEIVAAEITTGLGFGIQEALILERAVTSHVYGIDAQTAFRSARSSLDQSFGDGLKRLNDIRCRSGLGCSPL